MVLSQFEEKPSDGEALSSAHVVSSAPAANGVSGTSCPNGLAAPPPLLHAEMTPHPARSATSPSLPGDSQDCSAAVPEQQLSSRATISASRRRLLEVAVRRRLRNIHYPGPTLDPRPGAEAAACHSDRHLPEPTKLLSTRSDTTVGTRTTTFPPAERPTSAVRRMDTRPTPSPAPLPAHRQKVPAKHSPAPDGSVLPHRSPHPLFSPTTVITGDSIVRNIRFFNGITRCFPGATVADILDKLPKLLLSIPSSVCCLIIHVGTNDMARRQSELTKKDFNDLFSLLKNCVFLQGGSS
ncbi:uncharacterized protein LOC127533140 [Acanthochromis polyacanthus]|uniref:uncharacterized protein LOC127533140 n=1 Tax=Acanthochromis polyacanthus TaxID=80966 RepID=UPI002233E557|nr:uncharacterized protein LOC127533140 [Acanthochromis polyacanthus]